MGPFVKISVPCLTLAWLQLGNGGVLLNRPHSLWPCWAWQWLLWDPPPNLWSSLSSPLVQCPPNGLLLDSHATRKNIVFLDVPVLIFGGLTGPMEFRGDGMTISLTVRNREHSLGFRIQIPIWSAVASTLQNSCQPFEMCWLVYRGKKERKVKNMACWNGNQVVPKAA